MNLGTSYPPSSWQNALFDPWLLLRFIVTAGVNFLLSIALFALCIHLHMAYWLASLITLTFGVTNNFFAYRRFVFLESGRSYFLRYAAIQVVIYFVNLVGRNGLTHFGFGPLICYAILLPPCLVVSYALTRLYAFPPNLNPRS